MIVDLRSPEATQRLLGGLYPASCLYMETAWVQRHHEQVQRLVRALLKTLRFIQTHSAEEIASQLPPSYFAGDRELYVRALAYNKAMFTPDGRMPQSGPATVLKVLATVDRAVVNKTIDLDGTYTTEFIPSAAP